jgi:cell division protein FtsB
MINIPFLNQNLLLVVVTILNISLWGCTIGKMGTCNLLKEINIELQETATNYQNSDNIDEIKQVANKFKEAEEKILAAKVKDQNLLESSQKLANIYAQYSQVTIDYISAYQKKDGVTMNQYQQKMNQLFAEQNIVIQQINDYCQGK